MVTRQARLPGDPHYVRQAVWNSTDRAVTAFALVVPGALMVVGLVLSSAVAWTGGIATAVTAVFLAVLWSLETRTVAIGHGWLAVKARLAPSWVVVPAADIVSVRRRRLITSGLAVRLTSGPPVFIRKGDLEDGIAAAMSEDLGLRTRMEAALAELHAEQEAAAAATAGAAGGGAEQMAVVLTRGLLAEGESAERASAWPTAGPLRRRAGRRARHEWSAWLRRWSPR
jgi:hypothetical protein